MIAFERFGKGEHKVIGIHGWFGDETTFVPLQQSLAADKFECAWLAHRGYGKSQGVPGRYTMDEMAEDAMAVANQLGWNRFSVIGHSMGGKAAQLVVARAGDRVRKLVCVTPVTAAPVPFDEQSRALFEGASTDTGLRETVVGFSVGGRLSEAWIGKLVADSFARSNADAFAAYFRSWADDDVRAVLGQVNIETLVLAGAEDPTITLAFCEDGFRPHFTNLVIESIPNSGHYPMDETPLIFGARVGSFLAGPSVEH